MHESREMYIYTSGLTAVKFLRFSPTRQMTRRANSRASKNPFCAFRDAHDATSSKYVSRAFCSAM